MKQLFTAATNRQDRIEQLVNPEVNQGVTGLYNEITTRLNEISNTRSINWTTSFKEKEL